MSFPAYVQIETHNHCNLSCTMCAHKIMKRPQAYMDDKLLDKILKEIVAAPEVKTIFPHHLGEPLLDPRMEWLIVYLRQNRPDIKIYLYSNCLLLQPHMAHWQFNQLIASVDAATVDTYQNIKGKNAFNLVIDNLKKFVEERDMYGYTKPGLSMNFTLQDGNKHEISAFYDLSNTIINPKLDQIRIVHPANFANTFHDSNLCESWGKGCTRLKNCHILLDGKVCSCCYDYEGDIILGDLNKESIRNVWSNGLRWIFLKSHENKEYIGMCKTCNMR